MTSLNKNDESNKVKTFQEIKEMFNEKNNAIDKFSKKTDDFVIPDPILIDNNLNEKTKFNDIEKKQLDNKMLDLIKTTISYNNNNNDVIDIEIKEKLKNITDIKFYSDIDENNYNGYFGKIFDNFKEIYNSFKDICNKKGYLIYNPNLPRTPEQIEKLKKSKNCIPFLKNVEKVFTKMNDFNKLLKSFQTQDEVILPNEFTLTFKKEDNTFKLSTIIINKKIFFIEPRQEFNNDIIDKTITNIKSMDGFNDKLDEFKNYKPPLRKGLPIDIINQLKNKGGKTIKKRNKNKITRKYK
jgi:hypothetical protein